jgi:hypothetical protein
MRSHWFSIYTTCPAPAEIYLVRHSLSAIPHFLARLSSCGAYWVPVHAPQYRLSVHSAPLFRYPAEIYPS